MNRLFYAIALSLFIANSALAVGYQQTNLASSATDPDLINPWGISESPTSPFWVSDNGTGKATLYNTAGVKQGLVVSMPAAAPITGTVFNGTANFQGDTFLFASEAGTIIGWRGALGTNAEQLYSVSSGIYKGLAISTAKDTIYAANFHSGAIDVYDSTHAAPIGSFTDPNAPAGYAPFNIQNVGGKFYVTYAVQDAAKEDDVAGAGNGLVDVFDPVTHTFARLVTGGKLNSPWGVALAPAGFGDLAGKLLVGNFGNGVINAYDPNTGASIATLSDAASNPLINDGLWALNFGNGGNGGDPNTLYFTAGGATESTGLLAAITPVPEPDSFILLSAAIIPVLRRKRRLLR